MSKYLDAYARTVIAIRKDGHVNISIPVLIMHHTGHTWAKDDLVKYMSKQLKFVVKSVREMLGSPKDNESLHLVSQPFFLQGYDKLFPPIPMPRNRSEWAQAERQARLCLPIAQPSFGIRFVVNHHDFLLTFNHNQILISAESKKRIRTEHIMLDDKKKLIVPGAAEAILKGGHEKGKPFGSYSPVILTPEMEEEFKNGWQSNFMK